MGFLHQKNTEEVIVENVQKNVQAMTVNNIFLRLQWV